MFNFNKDKNSNFATIKKAIIAIILFVFILILFMGCRNMVADGIISDAGELSRVRTDTRAKIIAESGIEVSVTDDYSYHFDGTGTLKTDEEDTSEISSGEDEDTVSDSSASYADNQTERSIEDTDAEENVSDNSLKLQQSYNYNYDTSAETEKKSKEPSGITQIIKKAADVVSGNSDKSSASTKTESKHSSATTTTTHKHQYRGIVTKKPSCTEDGIVTYTCAECNDTYTKIQKATGHNYVSEITKEPTCISEGIKTYTCSLCGDTYTEKISMSEHSYGEPYDGGDGYTYKKCSVCGDTVTVDTVNYSISYDTDGGALIDYVMSYTVDSNINLPVPTKNGYTFNGWEDENGNIITTTSNCVGDLELKALWSGNTTEISFVNNGEVIKTVSAIIGNVIGELPDLTETGKVFTGWFTSADGGVMVTEDYVINDEDLILYAVFDEEVETITITDSVTNESTTYTVIYGESIGEFTYTEHDGYTFTGFVDSEGNIVTEDTIVSSNMTITAEYEVISYDITYVLNGGSETTQNPTSYTVNDSFELTAPEKEGYTFAGWTGSNGEMPCTTVNVGVGTTGTLTYIAIWSAKADIPYTVVYSLEQIDGSYVTDSSEVLYGTTDEEVTPEVKSYDGYTSPDEQTVAISADGSTVVTYKYTLIYYNITYELNGGAVTEANPSTYTVLDIIELNDPVMDGYYFAGWSELDGSISKGTTGDLIFTANWSIRTDIEYTVVYSLEQLDGSYVADSSEVLYGTTGEEVTPEVKSYDGYTSPDEQTVVISTDGSTVVTYKYSLIHYGITYELDGGSTEEENPTSYTILDEITLNAPEREGYDFVAWADSEGNIMEGAISKGTTGEKMLYATWKERVAYLLKGASVNEVFKTLSGSFDNSKTSAEFTTDELITVISKADSLPEDTSTVMTISDPDNSEYPVYAWFNSDTGSIYWYSEAAHIYLNENTQYMFSKLVALKTVDLLTYCDASEATTFDCLFYYCSSLTGDGLDFSSLDISSLINMDNMFSMCTSLTSLDLSNLDASNVTSLAKIFYKCTALTSINLNNIKSSSVTDMSDMFYNCTSLAEIDLSNFDTSSVTTMSDMFYNCSKLTEIDVSGFDTSNCKTFGNMFYNCYKLTEIDVSGFDTSSVTTMSDMFYNCSSLTEIDVSGFDTSNCTSFGYMFYNCYKLTEIDVSGFDTSKCVNTQYMFANCRAVTGLDMSNFVFSNITNAANMFYWCSGLTSITGIELWDTSNVTTMKSMFAGCSSLTKLDVSGFNTGKVKNMSGIFNGCSGLTYIDVSGFDTSNCTDMSSMFKGCNNITELDVTGFDTSKVLKMDYMFDNCRKISAIDVSSFDTSKVTNMSNMFHYCPTLTQITGLDVFDTSAVTDMSCLFSGCSGLTYIDVSGFETSKVTNMRFMFASCSTLTSIDVSSFDTSKVTNMEYMFSECSALTNIDVSGFNTSNVKSISGMFTKCSGLITVDMSGFDTANVTSMGTVFENCSSLVTIYASDSFVTTKVTYSTSMFGDCSSVVGGNGTTYDSNNINATYAVIDTDDTPGYFTEKQ